MASLPIRYASLFSGIEAASVAWEPLGWKPVLFSEIDEFPSAVLSERFPNVPNLGDVTKVDWSQYHGAADVCVGGPPCQEFSVAGLREGVAGDRGRLYLEFLEAARAIGSRWVVIENVPGLLSVHGGGDFQTVLETVADLWPDGGACWRVLDAAMFGCPQRRRRVYLVIHATDWRRAAAALYDGQVCDRTPSEDGRAWEEAARRAGLGLEDHCLASPQANAELTRGMAVTLTTLHEPPIWFRPDGDGYEVTRLSPEDYELCQGFPSGWTRVPWGGRPAGRCPANRRYRAVGNSMAVPVMRWIGKRIELVEGLTNGDQRGRD